MFIYILLIAITYLMLIFAKRFLSKDKIFYALSIAVSMLPLSFLAAFRDSTVGTDTATYIQIYSLFSSNDYSFSTYFEANNNEFVWYLLQSGLSFFDANARVFLGLSEFITLFVIFVGFKKFKPRIDAETTFLLYLLTLYNFSLNGMRSAMALSFFVLAISYFANKKPIPSFLFACLSILIHSSSLIIVFFYLIIELSKKQNNILRILLLVVPIVLLIVFPIACQLLIMIRAIPTKYSIYISTFYISFNIRKVIVYAVPLIIALIFRKKLISLSPINYALIVLLVCEFLLTQMSDKYQVLYRIVNCFGVAKLLLFGQIFAIQCNKHISFLPNIFKGKLLISKIILVSYFCFYWWYYYALLNISETIPYIFMSNGL